MALGVPPDVLVPAGAGALALVVGLLAVVVGRRSRRRRGSQEGSLAMASDLPTEETVAYSPTSTAPPRASSADVEHGLPQRPRRVPPHPPPGPGPAPAGVDGHAPTDPAMQSPTDHTQLYDAVDAAWADGVRQPSNRGETPSLSDSPQPRADDTGIRRLLAVLVDNPDEVLTAARELQACRARLDRLSEAIRNESAVLSDLLARLARAGLHPEQLARLACLPIEEVREMLRTHDT